MLDLSNYGNKVCWSKDIKNYWGLGSCHMIERINLEQDGEKNNFLSSVSLYLFSLILWDERSWMSIFSNILLPSSIWSIGITYKIKWKHWCHTISNLISHSRYNIFMKKIALKNCETREGIPNNARSKIGTLQEYLHGRKRRLYFYMQTLTSQEKS